MKKGFKVLVSTAAFAVAAVGVAVVVKVICDKRKDKYVCSDGDDIIDYVTAPVVSKDK